MYKLNKFRRELSLTEAAEKSPTSRIAFERLSSLIQKNLKECPSLETPPIPSDDPADPLNLAVQCLHALQTSLSRGLLELSNANPAGRLLVQLYPSITSWTEYCIHHIVIPDRTSEFQLFGLQTVLSSIIMAYCTNSGLYPLSPPDSEDTVYMPNLIPLLFHTHHLVGARAQYEMLNDLFQAIMCIVKLDSQNWDAEPMWRTELYRAVASHIDSLVSAYVVVVTTLLDVFRLVDTQATADDWLKTFHDLHVIICKFCLPKYSPDNHDMTRKMLYDRGQFRLMFRALSLIASSKLLRTFVFDVYTQPSGRTLTKIWNCFSIVANTITNDPGLPLIHLAYSEQLLINFFKLDQYISHSRVSCETVKEDHAGLVERMVHMFTKYLVFYSTTKFARKTCVRIMQLNMMDGPFKDIWQVYIKRVTELEAPSEEFRVRPPAMCDAQNCPDRQIKPKKLMGCSGCGTRFLYCSRECQRTDWLAGHRETCVEVRRSAEANYGYPTLPSSRDAHFIRTLIHSHIADLREQDPTNFMVRRIDFTQPQGVEATLVDPETYPDLDSELMIASAKTEGGVLVHAIIPSVSDNKIEIMHDDPEYPLVYVPQSLSRTIEDEEDM